MKCIMNIAVVANISQSRKAALVAVLCITWFAAAVMAQTGSRLFLVDFESYEEGTAIGNQYAHLGVTFSLADNPNDLPIIAVEGSPTVAFQGTGADTPMSSGAGGLTDPLVGGEFMEGQDIAIDFDPPVTSIRMFVIDIDVAETVTVRAYDGGVEVDSVTHSSGQAGTGDGKSTEFFVSAETITRVVIDVPAQIGFAMDFLSFTRPCEGDECGPTIEITQESAPGAGDFSNNVLGFILAYPTSSSAASFYAYNVPEGDSWNGQSLKPVVDRSHLLVADTTDGLTLVVVHDRAIPDDPDGGLAEMRFELLNDPDGIFRSVEDDPPSNEAGAGYAGGSGDMVFTTGHKWSTCCTDGVALSGLDGPWSMFVQFTEVDGDSGTAPIQGLNEWFAYSSDGTEIGLAMEVGRRVRLRGIDVSIPGDLNFDGFVNFYDFALFAGPWLETSCLDPSWCGGADLNQDGSVNEIDLADFAINWLMGFPVK